MPWRRHCTMARTASPNSGQTAPLSTDGQLHSQRTDLWSRRGAELLSRSRCSHPGEECQRPFHRPSGDQAAGHGLSVGGAPGLESPYSIPSTTQAILSVSRAASQFNKLRNHHRDDLSDFGVRCIQIVRGSRRAAQLCSNHDRRSIRRPNNCVIHHGAVSSFSGLIALDPILRKSRAKAF
jgi:hypothetical protein